MDFTPSARVSALSAELTDFLTTSVLPAESVLDEQCAASADSIRDEAPILDALKKQARSRGLWNLFLVGSPRGPGLTNLEYAPLAEITGWSPDLAPEATNCSAPDTGNMELLELFGTVEQQRLWLDPLLEGEIRSCFAMTEPEVASSDARNISTRIRRDGGDYVVTGHKWWASGALRERCALLVVLGVTDPDAAPSRRHSMILVPKDTPGVRIVRSTPVFGYEHASVGGHAEIWFDDVRVPAANLLGTEGAGFGMAQARLGPGRVHHCMRLLGQAERALELMCRRAQSRTAFGAPLADQGVVREQIALSRMEVDQARLIVLKTAWLIDTVGNRSCRTEISTIKALVPRVVAGVVDRAIQVHGAAGVSADTPLARFYTDGRFLRIGDGPDEVHVAAVARRELARYGGLA